MYELMKVRATARGIATRIDIPLMQLGNFNVARSYQLVLDTDKNYRAEPAKYKAITLQSQPLQAQ
jgi:hypothetical protein